MSEILIDAVKRVEKYALCMPMLEEMAAQGNFSAYVAGSLMIKYDPDKPMASINIEPLEGSGSEIIERGQYLASKIFVEHKKESCFYDQAVSNVEQYEKRYAVVGSLADITNSISKNW